MTAEYMAVDNWNNASRGGTLDSVRVDRKKLLNMVTLNRENHRGLFEKAQVGYRKAVIEELDRMLELARTGQPLKVAVGLEAPVDHTDDYDRVIGMLTMSVDDVVELDGIQFQQFVMDKWSWSKHALVTNTMYAKGR